MKHKPTRRTCHDSSREHCACAAQVQTCARLDGRLGGTTRCMSNKNLDGTGFRAELLVDDEGIVVDHPDLFRG